METREKQLLAQELYKRNGRCETVRYEDGAIIIDNGEPYSMEGPPGEIKGSERGVE